MKRFFILSFALSAVICLSACNTLSSVAAVSGDLLLLDTDTERVVQIISSKFPEFSEQDKAALKEGQRNAILLKSKLTQVTSNLHDRDVLLSVLSGGDIYLLHTRAKQIYALVDPILQRNAQLFTPYELLLIDSQRERLKRIDKAVISIMDNPSANSNSTAQEVIKYGSFALSLLAKSGAF